ncbi:MAG: hypothetical protein ABJM11_01410 [Marinobacter sp.]|uniref:hypothetical protein n=1 Tax=Marinobacter sp. TaxID=50741 RepID=UPI003298D000
MMLSAGKKNSLRSDTFFPAESTPTPSGLNHEDIALQNKLSVYPSDIDGVRS